MKLGFKPKQVTESLLSVLQDRARDIIERRYGLVGSSGERMTLEAIGGIYDITRERVRQIENFALSTIRKSDEYSSQKAAFDNLVDVMTSYGGLVKEEQLLLDLSKDKVAQNQLHFLLTLGEQFVRIKEDNNFHHRWSVDEEVSDKVHRAIKNLHKELTPKDLIAEGEILVKFLDHLKGEIQGAIDEEQAKQWLGISKGISRNPIGEWGLTNSPNIKTRGMRDYAYLVLRQSGEPLHFSDVASQIEAMFGKKAHVATCHNELIKDDRFVLVGRGLYALSEWGYTNGIVRDVIKKILTKKGPLAKNDLINEVLKQRKVRENTIYVNLQNNKYFKKSKDGKYSLV